RLLRACGCGRSSLTSGTSLSCRCGVGPVCVRRQGDREWFPSANAARPRAHHRPSLRATGAHPYVSGMGARNLYLHETVDIVGQGQYDYMECVTREPTNVMPGMLTLQGTFFVCAVGGGRWPQVVNIWDVGPDGWRAWAANVDRLNLKRRNAFYGDWWDEAAQWRSGGLDRLCGGVPGSPTTAELAERGVEGTLFIHQLVTV